ncbi:Nitrous oxide reductase maturation protein NosR [Rubellimicrobium mesophilum DSM 19309]|uniref:Nitrous oxide reductase maturation protein NosR n=1 Tax=Rubellimicrobium mesophilum DSM 19309 TaxID=442562 RepID=A0A017HK96_9RHOB|nr:4Fe-4S binding protein [Rubellimicrobium mesophilum]EYD74922.1 Nitrous oxide reductase maturation protein NosR [Rubellimicrobium mesophilum DSM 19309]
MAALRLLLALLALLLGPMARAEVLDREALSTFVRPPMSVGEPVSDRGVWELLNSGGALAGYVFETEPMAPIPGFSGAPIDLFVAIDLDGRFIDVRIISQNEPIFVSGLGEAPFRAFLEQYRGLSISQPMVVGTPYGDAGGGSALIYLDGVTKATASVRIAHESLLAATREVVREKMEGVASAPPAAPDPAHEEDLTWADLVRQGIATRHLVTNAEIDAAFVGTTWAHDDPEAQADPSGAYLDLWIVDLGPPSIARAALSPETVERLARFLEITPSAEPILLIDAGRHGLVSEDFVRNTAPDLLTATQDGLPVALRDADLTVGLAEGVPQGTAMILRTDRRLGFDPSRPWTLEVEALREHGSFQPEIGRTTLTAGHSTPERFFLREDATAQPASPVVEALRSRATDLAILGGLLIALLILVGPLMHRVARRGWLTPVRLTVLAVVLGFVGWWGQGQLSIVTVLGLVQAGTEGRSLAFLLYDPFSLMVWGVAILGFVLWGRGLFCGWLCPFGALQEFAHHAGRLLRLPQWEPNAAWDRRLKWVKYLLLAGLVATVLIAPREVETAAEVEPFKTAITVLFVRDWFYVVYAGFWLVLGLFLFKGFCRYVCPLGAVMALGGLLRGRDWIERRAECGSPCHLCKVRCRYGAIKASGRIDYSECFQCLDCVQIIDDAKQCVPRILAARAPIRAPRKEAA